MSTATGRRTSRTIRAFFWLCSLAFAINAAACINEYSTLLSGKVVMGDHGHCPFYVKEMDATELALKLDSLDGIGQVRKASFEELSDRGAALIYLGRYAEAIARFRSLQAAGFTGYAVCANLGTAFELIGRNDSALYYIREAVRQNPSAHNGSEWIHVRILERKVAMESGGTVSGTLLGVSFGEDALPMAPPGIELSALRDHLRYQLQERMHFVKPQDPIVGELLFELGNTEAFLNSVECAVDLYDLAKAYGFSTPNSDRRYAKLNGLTNKAAVLNAIDPSTDQKANWITWLFYTALLAIPFAILWGLWRWIRRRRAR